MVLLHKDVPDASSPLTRTPSITAPGEVGNAVPEIVMVPVITSASSSGVAISNKGALASTDVKEYISKKMLIGTIMKPLKPILFMPTSLLFQSNNWYPSIINYYA